MKLRSSDDFSVSRLPRVAGAFGVIVVSGIVLGLLMVLTIVLLPARMAVTRAFPAQRGTCTGGAMQIVAHQDDDLLFQSPDLLHDIQAGRCVRTVYVTAGDAAKGDLYWKGREAGSRAAYAQMAGVFNVWTTSDAGVAGRPIQMETLVGAPGISIVSMRLPDGNRSGPGAIVHHDESLMRLWNGTIMSIHAVDGSATYTRDSLRDTLTALMTAFAPTSVRTHDWTIPFGMGDHADHTATALFARQASQGYRSAHTLYAYGGYPIWTRGPNVVGADLDAKQAAFLAYAAHDSQMCLYPWCPSKLVFALRLGRQYIIASESIGNSARGPGVKVTASSENVATGQTADKVVDGIAFGDPIDRTTEWAAVGATAGSWIQLDFPTPTTVNGVVLVDRPNLVDQVTGGTLVFSDGSTVSTGALANNGSPVTIGFPARTTTSIRLIITSVSPTTQNIGLAEFETYANMPDADQPTSADTESPPPTLGK
jgi:LmbE family N-acetylglucosaminyl deacetylase